MARYRGTVISTRSAEETFDYLADFANAADWDPGTATGRAPRRRVRSAWAAPSGSACGSGRG